jgi:hypothetical protein
MQEEPVIQPEVLGLRVDPRVQVALVSTMRVTQVDL